MCYRVQGFHTDSITELARVSRGEVRIFTLVAVGEPTSLPCLGKLLVELAANGINGRILKVNYEFQRGADEMLVCARPNRGGHAFLLDTVVDPALQRRGIGTTAGLLRLE